MATSLAYNRCMLPICISSNDEQQQIQLTVLPSHDYLSDPNLPSPSCLPTPLFLVHLEEIRVRVMTTTTTTTTTQVCMIICPLRMIFRTVLGIFDFGLGLFSSFFMLPDVECEIIKNHMLLTHRGKPENPWRVLGRD